MANLRDIRNRIASVKSTQQITRAMQFVAAAKLRRAQENIIAARPYAHKMRDVLGSLALRAEASAHPLLARREEQRVELIAIASDRGLCAGFNANIVRRAVNFIREHEENDLRLTPVGRKGRDTLKRRYPERVAGEYVDIFNQLEYSHAATIGRKVVVDYTARNLDAVYMVYNEFKSVLRQEVVVERLLPLEPPEVEEDEQPVDFLYEPTAAAIYDRLLGRHVEVQVFRALQESLAAEQAARMNAMENATNNADEMIRDLTLYYNTVRQASITKELIEVVSGVEALKG